MAFDKLRAHIDQYATNKMWYWHLPLWLLGLYAFVKLLGFRLGEPMPLVVAAPYAFDFMLHEFAHILTAWLPPVITAAAGSASELLLGGLLVYGAFQFRNYFASLFCCLWMMLACLSAGGYMADARAQQIPLVSLGGSLAGQEKPVHDWNFVFGKLHLLNADTLIGGGVRGIGILFGIFGLGFSAWIVYKMVTAEPRAKALNSSEKELFNMSAAAAGGTVPPKRLPDNTPVQPKSNVYPSVVKGTLSYDSNGLEPPLKKDGSMGEESKGKDQHEDENKK